MPILDVEMVIGPTESLRPGLARELADLAGDVFGSPAGRTWVKLRTMGVDAYAENGGGPPDGIRPVFVTVLKAQVPPRERLESEVAELTDAFAAACGRPAENVHILYLPPAAGRASFGGNVIAD